MLANKSDFKFLFLGFAWLITFIMYTILYSINLTFSIFSNKRN